MILAVGGKFMLSIYKKVEKKEDNLYGAISINSIEELKKPFLLCLSAQDNNNKSVFGIIKEGARAARVYTTDEIGAGFKIDEFPVDFLGVKFTGDEIYKNNYEEIVDTFLYPFLIGDGTRTIEEIKKQARKINLMTYCDGTQTYKNIELRLIDKLKNNNISDENIKEIIRQISVVAIGTMVNTSDLLATIVTFVDVNDTEISTEQTVLYKNMLAERQQRSLFGVVRNSNNILYVYDGTGKHSLKEYFEDRTIVKPAVCSVVSRIIENAILNTNQNELISLSLEELIEKLKIYGIETETILLMEKLDQTISYDNSPKYTLEEIRLRQQLDRTYKELQKTKMRLESSERELQRKNDAISSVIEKVRKYSSDITFYQILVSAGLWQAPMGTDVFQEDSDRAIREIYDSTILNDENNRNPKK